MELPDLKGDSVEEILRKENPVVENFDKENPQSTEL